MGVGHEHFVSTLIIMDLVDVITVLNNTELMAIRCSRNVGTTEPVSRESC